MEHLWIVVTIMWLSGLLFAWRALKLKYGPALPGKGSSRELPPQQPPYGYPTAEELLRQRFVTGEIAVEEYERLLEVLVRHPLPARPARGDAPFIAAPQRVGSRNPRSPERREGNLIEVRDLGDLVQRAALGVLVALVASIPVLVGGFPAMPVPLLLVLVGAVAALGARVLGASRG